MQEKKHNRREDKVYKLRDSRDMSNVLKTEGLILIGQDVTEVS